MLLGLLVIRLIVAAVMPLSADEAYYRVWAHALAPGYFDHPPMVALWIRAGIAVAGDTTMGLRLLGPVSAWAGSLLLVSAGRDLALAAAPGASAPSGVSGAPGAIGWRAAWLLNATLLCNAGAVIMTPDTPLLLFWTAAIAAMARLVRTGDANWLLAAGAAAGLGMDSKYTAVLLAPALVFWLIAVPGARVWWRRWQLYGAAVLAVAAFVPVLAWNATHGWVSFARQGGRSEDFHPARALQFLLELGGSQLGLATPLLFGVFAVGVWRCGRGGGWRKPERGLLVAVTVVPALVFIQHALGGRVQANWPGVVYPGAALAAALALVPYWRGAVALGAALSAGLYLQAAAAPWALPRRIDFTLIRLAGWGGLTRQAEQAQRAAGAAFIAADEYGLASELAFHAAGKVVAAEDRWRSFALPPADAAGETGILVRSDRASGPPDAAVWPGAVKVGSAVRARAGVVAEAYTFYRVRAPVGVAAVVLPAGQ